MKIYTKTGDQGETGLFAGPRVRKDNPRIEAYGDVDELNSVLGLVRAEGLPAEIDKLVGRIQNELFNLGAELATPDPPASDTDFIGDDDVQALEEAIDGHDAQLKPLKQFILPGGSKASAGLHLARAVCRRAERRVVTLCGMQDEQISTRVVRYLNRLSDLLFVVARAVSATHGHGDVPWVKPSK